MMACDGHVIILLLLFGCHVNILVYELTFFLSCSFFWVISWRLNFISRRLGTLCFIFMRGVGRKNNGDEIFPTYTVYADETERSETSAYKIQTPGNYPKERIQHSEHGKSLKSRLFSFLPPWRFEILQTFVKLIDLYFYKFLSIWEYYFLYAGRSCWFSRGSYALLLVIAEADSV